MLNRIRATSATRNARTVRAHPDYPGQVSEGYLVMQRKRVDEGRSKDFALTPICEAGW